MNELDLYARWMIGLERIDESSDVESKIRDVAKRVERRRGRLEDGIAKLVQDLKSDLDVLMPTLSHSAESATVHAAVSNVMQRLVDVVTAQGLE